MRDGDKSKPDRPKFRHLLGFSKKEVAVTQQNTSPSASYVDAHRATAPTIPTTPTTPTNQAVEVYWPSHLLSSEK